MNDYILSCCTTSDLTKEVYDKNDIKYVGCHFFLGDKEYIDDLGKTISYKEFYSKMEQDIITKTSQVNVEQFIEFFEPFLKQGKDIFHVTLSSGISGTVNSANTAKALLEEKYPERKIIIIDSLAASTGYGLIMIKLAELRKQGKTMDELQIFIEDNKLKLHHWFFSTTLKYYVRGGRVKPIQGFFGTMFKICPLLNVDYQGKLIPREKIRTKKRVITRTVEKMEENADKGLDYDDLVYISHSNCLEDAKEVCELVKTKFKKIKDIKIFDIGTTIGSHSGPGTVALFFWGSKRNN